MRLLALAALALLPAAASAAVLCPAVQDGRRLRNVTLSDGPPAELASLVPDQQGRRIAWNVASIRQAGHRAHLVCGYGRATQNLEAEVPAGAGRCAFKLAADGQVAGAVECR